MRNGDNESTATSSGAAPAERERLVYILPADVRSGAGLGDGIELHELWRTLWSQRLLVVAVTAAFVSLGIAYSLLAEHWFRADVTLSSVTEEALPAALSQFAGLASMAGISIPASRSAESIATLRSREFAAEFITDRQLLPILFADKWSRQAGTWKESDPAEIPRLGDAVKYFRERVLSVSEDKQTGLVTLSIRWKDPVLAADWANDLVRRVNSRLRLIAVQESERNIEFLRAQLVANPIVTVQQSAGRVLEAELQKLMLAKGSEEFAFKVIDPASVPLEKYKPQRILITLLSAVAGGLVALMIAMLRRKRHVSP